MPDIDLDRDGGGRSRLGRLAPLIAVAVLAVVAVVTYRIVTLLLEGRGAESEARRALAGTAANEARTGATSVAAVPGGDDLKVIEGIGPRFESVLKAAGITTFRGLAETGSGRIETILRESGGRMADASTWPAQARLAADGAWLELSEMQAMLKAGRAPK